jgi:benzoate membrane transport protein
MQKTTEYPAGGWRRNLRDLPASLTLSTIMTGFLVVLVAYTGPLLIVIEAAKNAPLTSEQTSSWVWAMMISSGILSIVMSLRYRQPVIAAYSVAGAALLVTTLSHYQYSEVIGAYLVAALACTLLGVTRSFSRLIALVPNSVVMGMLAGVLFRFGTGLFAALPTRPLMIAAMAVVFYLLKRLGFRAPSLGALIVGVLIAAAYGDLQLSNFTLSLAVPTFTAPTFSAEAILSLGLPLFMLSITSQHAPGIAVLRASGYETPADETLTFTGIASLVVAFFGSHGQNLSAITAAMVTMPEAHPDPNKRYAAGIATGVWYLVFGAFGATAIDVFSTFPAALIAGVAGLALIGAIMNAASGAMENPKHREAGLVVLLCTAANFTLFGIGAPFWGLIAGVVVDAILTRRQSSSIDKG